MDDCQCPAMVLGGLTAGLAAACVGAAVFWPAAPMLPFVLGIAAMPFAKANGFALGAWAAACGVPAFLITLAVLFLI